MANNQTVLQTPPEDSMLRIGLKPFLTALSILMLLIIFSGFLTRCLQGSNR